MSRSNTPLANKDRFVSSRSREREQKFESFSFNDKIERYNKKESPENATRESDQNEVYLSLLKSQICSPCSRETTPKPSRSIVPEKLVAIRLFQSENEERSEKKLKEEPLLSGEPNQLQLLPIKVDQKSTGIGSSLFPIPSSLFADENMLFSNYSSSLLNLSNFQTSFKRTRKINTSPYKVLEAPCLRDDFYLHLLDWSAKDFICVGLDSSVYLWNNRTSTVSHFIALADSDEHITSLGWLRGGELLAIGESCGKVGIWDVEKDIEVMAFKNHQERIAVIRELDYNMFTSGSQDHCINNFDLRSKGVACQFLSHTQEICGLNWSIDRSLLASGGNDNKLMIWSLKKPEAPLKKFTSHKSAVKAIGWSNKKYGLLASGGGTQDRTIKFWDTKEMKNISSVETNSQVCNLIFSKSSNEFVTSHGFTENTLIVWDFPSCKSKGILRGHKDRVIYMAMSPDGTKVVTGAGDETVRFWEVFENSDRGKIMKGKANKFDYSLIR